MSLIGIRPQKLLNSDYHCYLEDDQYPEYIKQEHDMQQSNML